MKYLTNEKLTIVGAAGMIGSNMAQTALMLGLTPNLCLYDVYEPGLKGVVAEMNHCAFPGMNITWTTDPAVAFKDAKWFNPLNGEISDVAFDGNGVDICLRSGESMILQTFDKPVTAIEKAETTSIDKRSNVEGRQISLDGPWTLSFVEEAPKVGNTYQLAHLQSWEGLDEQTKVTMGTGVYTTHVKMSKKDCPENHWLIDLGDVRESARVYINGTFVGCAWSVPFVLDTKGALRVGDNEVRIEVTNLPANRISDLDRKGVKWRKMEEINVVDINYRKTTYDQWEPMPSGLNSAVKLIMK